MKTPLVLCSTLLLFLQHPSAAVARADARSHQASTVPGSAKQHVIAQGVHDPSFAGMGASESVTHKAHIKRALVGAASVLSHSVASEDGSADAGPSPKANRKIKRDLQAPAEHMHHNRDTQHQRHITRSLVGHHVEPRNVEGTAEPIPARKWKRKLAPPAEHAAHSARSVIAQVIGGALGQPGVSAQQNEKRRHQELLKRMEHEEKRRDLERKAHEKAKRWIWATSIIQDGDPNAPPIGTNVNMLSSPYQTIATPSTTPLMPSFPPAPAATGEPLRAARPVPSAETPAALSPNAVESPGSSSSTSAEPTSEASSTASTASSSSPTPIATAKRGPRVRPLAQPLTLASLNNAMPDVHPPQHLGQRDLGAEHEKRDDDAEEEELVPEDEEPVQEQGDDDVVVIVGVGWDQAEEDAEDAASEEPVAAEPAAEPQPEAPVTKTAPGFSKQGHMERVRRVYKARDDFKMLQKRGLVARD